MPINRRLWLQQTSLAVAVLATGQHSFASERKSFFNPPEGPIRLHGNENPYGPSPLARTAMAAAINSSNCYPWEVTTQLREKIAAPYGLSKENIVMGAGSSEILGLVAQYAALQKGNAVAADPTFGIWFTAAQQSGLNIVKVPLTSDKKHDLQRMKEQVNAQTKLVYICNPNNPTGTVLPAGDLRLFVDDISRNTLVLLDEAYTEYSDEPSLAARVKNNPNLVVAKTFSKIYGLAGARIGYALAHTDTIRKLNELQPWSNAGASAVSLAGALASLDDHSFIAMSKTKNTAVRKNTIQSFEELQVPYIPSHTNFLYYSLENQKKDFLALLPEHQIRGGRITEAKGKWTRISIGTPDDMAVFTRVLKKAF